jgi:hypothetical protein
MSHNKASPDSNEHSVEVEAQGVYEDTGRVFEKRMEDRMTMEKESWKEKEKEKGSDNGKRGSRR